MFEKRIRKVSAKVGAEEANSRISKNKQKKFIPKPFIFTDI